MIALKCCDCCVCRVVKLAFCRAVITGILEHQLHVSHLCAVVAQFEQIDFDQILIIMIKMICRMSEMLSLECANVDLKENIMRGGIKTENGKNRVIPIHPKLRPIIEAHLSDSKYLFPIYQPKSNVAHPESPMKSAFNTCWKKYIRETLHLEHTSHECRHTFRSKLDSAGANKVAIDLIMGHKTADVGERVYTHKTLDELKTAIEKLSYEL